MAKRRRPVVKNDVKLPLTIKVPQHHLQAVETRLHWLILKTHKQAIKILTDTYSPIACSISFFVLFVVCIIFFTSSDV